MRRRCWMAGMAAATSVWLAGGCGTAPARKPVAPKDEPRAVVKRERAEGLLAEQRAAAHAHYAAGVIREMNNEAQAATDEYCQAALLDPGDEELILDVSRRLLQHKQAERALEVVQRAAAQPGASGQIHARLGLIYSQLGQADQATAANREAIRKSPESLAGYQNLCLGYLRNKQPEEALAVLDEALRQRGAEVDFLIGVGELCATIGAQAPAQKASANAKALVALNRAVERGPLTPLLRLRLAEGFNLLGESTRAAEFYLEVLKQPPDLPLVEERVRANLTNIYLRGSDRKGATEQLEAILRRDPTNPQAHYYLGRLALEGKEPAKAADHLGKTVLLSPGLESAYLYLALAQLELSQSREARATLDQARQKFPQSFALEFYTALAYSRQKAYADALRHFVAAEVIAKATDPTQLNEGFYFQLGATCERKGDYAQAEQYFEKCLQLAPNFAEAQNYLGYMWAERGLKLERARELIEKAVQAEPKNAAFLDSLGWVLFKLNQPKEALPHILKAVELSEQPDATLYDHLGDIRRALQEPEKAREAWRKSLAIEPNEAVRKKLEASSTN